MKVLIATMTCGEGHNAIARSIRDGFSAEDEVKIVNIYGHLGKRDRQGKWYLFFVKHFPRLYTFVWNCLRKRNPDRRYSGVIKGGIKSAADEMERVAEEFQPDAVICTHNQASNIFCWLKIHNRFRGKLYSVLTDYVACPFWEGSVLCDGIFTPHKVTHAEMISRGFREEQLHAFGIPVNPKFYKTISKEEARAMLRIAPDSFVVLSVNGGLGVGNIAGFVKNASRAKVEGLQLLVVCGRNERAYKKISDFVAKKKLQNVRVFGFVDNLDVMLSASDLFFCRGGSGAVTESLIKGVPFVVREGAVVQEKLNGRIIARKGEYFFMNSVFDARKLIEQQSRLVNTAVGGGYFLHGTSARKRRTDRRVCARANGREVAKYNLFPKNGFPFVSRCL